MVILIILKVQALKYAIAMGAEILEFHLQMQGRKIFRDHKVSLTPHEVKELIDEMKLIDSLKGEQLKKPTQIELDHAVKFHLKTVYLTGILKRK